MSLTKSLVLTFCKSRFLFKNLPTCQSYYRFISTSRIICSPATIIRPDSHKKGKVIEIWEGMTPRDISRATGLTFDEVREVMDYCNLNWINSLQDVKAVLAKVNYRFTVIANPNNVKIEKQIDLPSLIESKRVPEGRNLQMRPPIVTIMGHVDHGKTTLLDSLRHSSIVDQEFGGITQHIGAFVVSLGDEVKRRAQFQHTDISKLVTFLDTPGHAAFSSMRQRGANITDIVVLVVAADDGVMPQTLESIKYAKNAEVPIIVAVNKIDKVSKPAEAIKKIRTSLHVENIITEEDGGDTQLVSISALKGDGLRELKEAILVLAETLDLKAPYDGGVSGSIVESKLDQSRGKLATILVEKGVLKKGDYLLAGETNWCRVRAMFDERLQTLNTVSPGLPAQIIGWREEDLPEAGDRVYQFVDEKTLKEVLKVSKGLRLEKKALIDAAQAAKRSVQDREEYEAKRAKAKADKVPFWYYKYKGPKKKTYIDDPNEKFKLRLLIKADVHGSAEVLLDLIESYPNDNSLVKLDLLHYGVGPVTENDIELAAIWPNSIIYAFNLQMTPQILKLAKDNNVILKNFNVIYRLYDDLKKEITVKMPEIEEEVPVGEALVQKQFTIEEKNKPVIVAGCRCTKGPISRDDVFYKVIRNDQVVVERLQLVSMKHLKDDVKSIAHNMECGLRFAELPENFNFYPADRLLCYKMKKVKPTCKWKAPGF